MLEDISVSERRTRIRQLNPRERLADLAGDHLGDVFCQLKIKKSIPLGQVRDRGRDCEGAGDRGARGWLRRDFLPIKHYFPLWSGSTSRIHIRTYPFLSHILIPRFPTLFSRYFSLLIPSRQQQGRLLRTLQWPLAPRSRRRIWKSLCSTLWLLPAKTGPRVEIYPATKFRPSHCETPTCVRDDVFFSRDLYFTMTYEKICKDIKF